MLKILQGDWIEVLRTLPDNSVHCCVTSPPYWGLRDYGTASWEGGDPSCDHKQPPPKFNGPKQTIAQVSGHASKAESHSRTHCPKCGAKRVDRQLGLEPTPEEYIAKMVEGFREVRRVLRDDGQLWCNLGDSYAASATGSFNGGGFKDASAIAGTRDLSGVESCGKMDKLKASGLKPKDLCGIPWRVALALQADGWYLRSEITWCKKSAMPESVTDRPTSATEKIFLLTKSPDYFYDAFAVRIPYSEATLPQRGQKYNGNGQKDYLEAGVQNPSDTKRRIIESLERNGGANMRNYWLLGPEPYPEAHFATFVTEIPRRAILAGTSARGVCPKCGSPWERMTDKGDLQGPGYENYKLPKAKASKDDAKIKGRSDGWWPNHKYETKTIGWQPTCQCGIETTIPATVLDPFAGSFTTCQVAIELGRKAIGIELNPDYIELGKKRCNVTPGLQLA